MTGIPFVTPKVVFLGELERIGFFGVEKRGLKVRARDKPSRFFKTSKVWENTHLVENKVRQLRMND
jgi:hypothetical protein